MTKHTFTFGANLADADTAQHLLDALFNATLFASTDAIYPQLNAVRFEYRTEGAHQGLTLIATDRYTLSHQTLKAGSQTADSVDFSISLADAKALLSAHRKVQNLFLTVDAGAETLRVVGDVTTKHKLMPDDFFPKWAQLIPDQETAGPVESIAFNPKFLAKLGKVRQTGCQRGHGGPVMLRFQGSASKPSLAEISDGPTVLIMPVRLGG